jgi:hypothetical protein
MSNRPKKSKPKRRTPLTREQLLPLAPATARTLSLKNHLALVALRQGHGNADLVSELMRTLYLTFFANEAGRPNAPFDTFLTAELALKACIHQAVTADEWRLEAAQCEVIEAVLRAYDAQLTSLPAHKIEAATVRLGRMLERGSFPDLAATQESNLQWRTGQNDSTERASRR